MKVLDRATTAMRARGHRLSDPTAERSGKLLDMLLASSVRYLVELGRASWASPRNLVIGGACAVTAATVAWSAWKLISGDKGFDAEPQS